jgi:hypothetical protein
MESLARVHTVQGDHAAAEQCHRGALRILRLKSPPDNRDTIRTTIALAETLQKLDRGDEAAQLLTAILLVIEESDDADDEQRQRVASMLRSTSAVAGAER